MSAVIGWPGRPSQNGKIFSLRQPGYRKKCLQAMENISLKKVHLYTGEEQGKTGIGVRITDPAATLADLLDAWQPLCDDERVYKLYAPGNYASCAGCEINCCTTAYVIPDLIAFKSMSAYLGLSYQEFIDRYFQTEKVQLGLLRMKPNPCVFLENRLCTIYPLRSLICRFYLCSSLLGATEQFIYSLTWSGIAATQLFAEQAGLIRRAHSGFTSMDLLFANLVDDYRDHPQVQLFMQAEEYSDIPLLPFME